MTNDAFRADIVAMVASCPGQAIRPLEWLQFFLFLKGFFRIAPRLDSLDSLEVGFSMSLQ
jgi:hypothetical protein